MRFDPRIDMGEGADRAGDGASRDLLARPHHALARARELGIGARELQPEGSGLGMHAVTAAHGQRVLVLEGACFERGKQGVEIGDQQVRCLDELHVEAGVEHVRRGQPRMQKPRLGPDVLGNGRQKGDDVMLHLALDCVDAGNVETATLPDRIGGVLGDDPELGHGLGRIGLDLEPDAELVLRLPDASHFGAAIAGDHGCVEDLPRCGQRAEAKV